MRFACSVSYSRTHYEYSNDWASVSLFEATVAAIASGGFAYTFEGNSLSTATAVVLVAATPESIATLERVFQLDPCT
jgi:hypothetical protein